MTQPENIDPAAFLTAMATAMTQMHEVYASAVEAGFTEQQAMQIICSMIAAGIQQ